MTAERTVTVDQSDPSRGRYDPSRVGTPNPADTELRPATSAEDVAATRAELAELRRRRACPPRPPKVSQPTVSRIVAAHRMASGGPP